MLQARLFLFLLFFFVFLQPAISQDEDIFGISRKARNPKSESSLGNAFRSIQEMFSFQLGTGVSYYDLTTEFYKGDGSIYPITQYQNHDFGYFPLPDTLTLRGRQWALPSLEGGIRFNLFNILTLGAAYGMEKGNLGPLVGNGYQIILDGDSYSLRSYRVSAGLVLYDASRRRLLLKLKYNRFNSAIPDTKRRMQQEMNQRMRQNYPWRIVLEGEVGKIAVSKPAVQVPKAYLPQLTALQNSYSYAAALRVEYNLSEYASVFVKGKVELRSFTNASPDFAPFPMDQRLLGLQTGVSIQIPGTKRCKVSGCGVVMKHLHNGIEYRGSSIFNLQNRKVGQWY